MPSRIVLKAVQTIFLIELGEPATEIGICSVSAIVVTKDPPASSSLVISPEPVPIYVLRFAPVTVLIVLSSASTNGNLSASTGVMALAPFIDEETLVKSVTSALAAIPDNFDFSVDE